MYVTPKIFGVELDNLCQLLAYFIGIWRKASAYQIRTFQYGKGPVLAHELTQLCLSRACDITEKYTHQKVNLQLHGKWKYAGVHSVMD